MKYPSVHKVIQQMLHWNCIQSMDEIRMWY